MPNGEAPSRLRECLDWASENGVGLTVIFGFILFAGFLTFLAWSAGNRDELVTKARKQDCATLARESLTPDARVALLGVCK